MGKKDRQVRGERPARGFSRERCLLGGQALCSLLHSALCRTPLSLTLWLLLAHSSAWSHRCLKKRERRRKRLEVTPVCDVGRDFMSISLWPQKWQWVKCLGEQGAMCVWVAQSCLTLCKPMDDSPPGSSVHGILQAWILEWIAIPFSSGPSRPRDQTPVFRIAGRFFTFWATKESQYALSVHLMLAWKKKSSVSDSGHIHRYPRAILTATLVTVS